MIDSRAAEVLVPAGALSVLDWPHALDWPRRVVYELTTVTAGAAEQEEHLYDDCTSISANLDVIYQMYCK